MDENYLEDQNQDTWDSETDAETGTADEVIADQKWEQEHAAQTEILAGAWKAAGAGHALAMLKGIYASKYLDGLFRILRGMPQFEQLPDSELEIAIAEGIDRFYSKVAAGSKIFNYPAYLWKTCKNSALERYRKQQAAETPTSPDELDERPAPADTKGTEDRETPDRDVQKRALLNFARRTLPKLGPGNIQRVMECVFDAVENDVADLPPREIARITGLKANTVSVLVRRGFQRLAREAINEGLWDPIKAKHFIASFSSPPETGFESE